MSYLLPANCDVGEFFVRLWCSNYCPHLGPETDAFQELTRFIGQVHAAGMDHGKFLAKATVPLSVVEIGEAMMEAKN